MTDRVRSRAVTVMGIPPFSGFWAKVYVFKAAIAAGLWPVATLALVGSVIELGCRTGTPTPHIDAVYALVKLLAQTIERQRGRLQVTPF